MSSEGARPGDCGTFVPRQGAVVQTASKARHQDSAGDGNRPSEGMAPMAATVRPDLPLMVAGNPDQVPGPLSARTLPANLASLENPSALGCLPAAGRSACITGQIWAVNDGLDM